MSHKSLIAVNVIILILELVVLAFAIAQFANGEISMTTGIIWCTMLGFILGMHIYAFAIFCSDLYWYRYWNSNMKCSDCEFYQECGYEGDKRCIKDHCKFN